MSNSRGTDCGQMRSSLLGLGVSEGSGDCTPATPCAYPGPTSWSCGSLTRWMSTTRPPDSRQGPFNGSSRNVRAKPRNPTSAARHSGVFTSLCRLQTYRRASLKWSLSSEARQVRTGDRWPNSTRSSRSLQRQASGVALNHGDTVRVPALLPELHPVRSLRNPASRDPRTACFHARWTTEQAIKWAFQHDRSLSPPYDEGVSALLHEPTFKVLLGDTVFKMARGVIRLGNRAAHESRELSQRDSVVAVSHLFQFCYWYARTYGQTKPPAGLTFDPHTLPRPGPSPTATVAQIAELERRLEEEELARPMRRDRAWQPGRARR